MPKPSANKSASSPPPSPPQKPATSSASAMLTPSELARLRQSAKEAIAYGQKAFPPKAK